MKDKYFRQGGFSASNATNIPIDLPVSVSAEDPTICGIAHITKTGHTIEFHAGFQDLQEYEKAGIVRLYVGCTYDSAPDTSYIITRAFLGPNV